jgi:ABC-type nitrate/sulfonate/bicarbonate transport system substrate-binding protein
MAEYKPIEARALYRSHSHLPVWEVIDKAGIWEQVGMKVSFEFCASSSVAEAALFDGSIDFVSGNHITPYGLVARGKPIVSLASPSNGVNDKLVSRKPIGNLTEMRGKRLGDTTITDPVSGYHHPRGNHMLYLMRGGLGIDEVEWVELADTNEGFRPKQFEALKAGTIDASFVSGRTDRFEEAGLSVCLWNRFP